MQRRARGRGDAVDVAGDPAIEVVFIRKAADAQRRIVACFHRKGLALFEPRDVLIVQNGNAALIGLDSAAVVVVIKPERAPAVGFHREVAAGHAKVVAARGIHIERGASLPEYQARCPRGIVEGKVVELQDGVFREESHGAVLEFHFRAAFVRGKNVSLADGQIQPSSLPRCGGVRERITVGCRGEPDISLHQAQADDARVAPAATGGAPEKSVNTKIAKIEGISLREVIVHPLTGTRPESLDG